MRRRIVNATRINPRIAKRTEGFRSSLLANIAKNLEGQLHWAGNADVMSRFDAEPPISHKRVIKTPQSDLVEKNYNHFALWIRALTRGHTVKPSWRKANMSCWQAVLFGAYRAGLMSKGDLVQLHQKATQAAQRTGDKQGGLYGDRAQHEYASVIAQALNVHNAQPLLPTSEPTAGSLVFFDGLNHVAVSLGTKDKQGRHEVMSLWILPLRNDGTFSEGMRKTTVEQLRASYAKTYGPMGYEPISSVTYTPNPWASP